LDFLSPSSFIPPQNVYFLMLHFLVHKIFIFYINGVLNCKFPWLMKLEFPCQILEKSLNIKFHENPSSGVDMFNADRQTDTTLPIVVFRSFAYLPDDWPRIPTFLLSSGFLASIENYLKLHHNLSLPHPFQFILQVNRVSSQPFEGPASR
jgi:hypothetical protein